MKQYPAKLHRSLGASCHAASGALDVAGRSGAGMLTRGCGHAKQRRRLRWARPCRLDSKHRSFGFRSRREALHARVPNILHPTCSPHVIREEQAHRCSGRNACSTRASRTLPRITGGRSVLCYAGMGVLTWMKGEEAQKSNVRDVERGRALHENVKNQSLLCAEVQSTVSPHGGKRRKPHERIPSRRHRRVTCQSGGGANS
mmetsp:Transcript_42816/g.132262  ORF Transcript_42816/g.132262 Transcript_42816/m.132262 type:complete len:201 (-) Transcript_42816:686-1288(-)